MVQMRGHNICFHKIRKIIFKISSIVPVVWSSIKHSGFQVPSLYNIGLRVKKKHDQDVLGHHNGDIVQTDCYNSGSPAHSVPV